ncbi:flagellar basal body P-ring formation protein FlgA [Serratia rhizosphaerae]|uniref:Flagella basal body P-ring formation protein FlgA n=2 Tax=Serratia rhizosphaerae TaxID=2597702 RepID=A0ABX6GRX3_9GAMM|nr:flagellar basal body P-ring formation protein FlgA [Serratia rhizosphaerae]
MRLLLMLLALLSALPVCADDFSDQVERFIQAQFADSPVKVNVEVRTPKAQWPACATPLLALTQSARLWGSVTLSARCGDERRFIQTRVAASGRYLVAARAIRAGQALTAADVKVVRGRLDTLPPRALREARRALGAVSLRHIGRGQPLTIPMLRRPWQVKAGQPVQVRIQGESFTISGNGKAMNNAAVDDSVRVRMASGRIVSGTVDEDGDIRIAL